MTVVSGSAHQMTLDFEPGLADRHATLLDCVRECVYTQRTPLKTVAANMDLSQSELSRKLSGNPDDSRRFTCEDLEHFIATTGDVTPIYYLIERYLEDSAVKQQRALAELMRLAPQLSALIVQATKS
jgi:hypothetical protein